MKFGDEESHQSPGCLTAGVQVSKCVGGAPLVEGP